IIDEPWARAIEATRKAAVDRTPGAATFGREPYPGTPAGKENELDVAGEHQPPPIHPSLDAERPRPAPRTAARRGGGSCSVPSRRRGDPGSPALRRGGAGGDHGGQSACPVGGLRSEASCGDGRAPPAGGGARVDGGGGRARAAVAVWRGGRPGSFASRHGPASSADRSLAPGVPAGARGRPRLGSRERPRGASRGGEAPGG